MKDVLTDYFEKFTEGIFSTLNTPGAYLNKITLTAIVITISFLLYLLLKKVIKYYFKDFKTRIRIKTVTKSIIVTLTIISTLFIWIHALNAIVLVAMIIGVVIVFMVRGLTSNIIAYFIIRYRHYFKIGHRIEVNDIIGDVIEINLVSIKLLEVRNQLSSDANTGRVINLPNKIIFDEAVRMIGVNNEFIWHEIKYVLSFDSDWQTAEKIISAVGDTYFNESVRPNLTKYNHRLPNDTEELKSVFSLDTNDDGIILILRYLVDYENGTSTKTAIQRQILSEFEKNPQIKFATLDIRIFED